MSQTSPNGTSQNKPFPLLSSLRQSLSLSFRCSGLLLYGNFNITRSTLFASKPGKLERASAEGTEGRSTAAAFGGDGVRSVRSSFARPNLFAATGALEVADACAFG